MQLAEGIVIKANKYQENSKVLTIVSPQGTYTCLARAASKLKSKNYSYSQTLTKIGFQISKSKRNSFDILTTGTVINNYHQIKENYAKLASTLIIFDLTYHLSVHIDDFFTLYNFLDVTLERLESTNYYKYYEIIFRLKLLFLLGVGPTFSKCVNCGKKEQFMFFDFYGGGMKCKECTGDEKKIYRGDFLQTIQTLYNTKIENIDDNLLAQLPNHLGFINEFLDAYYEHFLGFVSKARDILDKVAMSK
ncbi:MAG: DNA repair protein RecO [Bacilli bacterium]|jgi:DNA repair protein RecO (recombination protein O)|nr:DNA repair protein RecO [Bacilli bacterium]MDD3348702.1 DNA repair protein RecO [Bacilli bacterium]MDD4056648.1 DNA repair protein RecO [Bacilli bacterium]MDY0208918.1 DNA repair protein RecO [Bacilli bacterium]